MKIPFIFLLLLFTLTNIQCGPDKAADKKMLIEDSRKNGSDSLSNVPLLKPITYHLLKIDSSSKSMLISLKGKDSMSIILALNRVDYKHLFRQDSIILPDTFFKDLMAYSPFPKKLKFLKEVKKLILFSYPIQAFAAYENGVLTRWGPNSMGKKSTPTPTGLFHTNWRSKRAISTIDPEWIMEWYFNLENKLGVSMHEYDLPGYPASHACIRLTQEDAFWFYNWAESWKLLSSTQIGAYGTPVIIYGEYSFGGKKPWLELAGNSNALKISADSLQKEINPFLHTIQKRQAERDSSNSVVVH